MTSSASSTGLSAPTRKVKGRSRPTTKSQITSTIVWTAIPPIRLPAASPRWPLRSGGDGDRKLRQASRDREQQEPTELLAEPEPRVEASVAFESAIPATQVAAAASTKTTTRSGDAKPVTSHNYRRGIG